MSSVALEGRHTTFSRDSRDILSTLKTLDKSVDSQDFLRICFSQTQRDMRHSNIDCRMIVARRIERRENVARMSCVDLQGRHTTINLALSGFRM
ncbi:hypothetical protein DPMN_076065 [Dreissena polymorpha]|uniref:Uncharacterized protein n=1 Tax=Dreissena polymorpha TaxID=45954 RepID=A0A9D3YMD6_DREPO|nr:hypothetical protein DPMN_076065 [Dreissena polymorpha]